MHSFSKSWSSLAGFVLFYIIYSSFGASVFSSIERPSEDKSRHDMERSKEEFSNQSCVSAASLELFLHKVSTANKYGVSVFRNSSGMSNWDSASSMFFANTSVTTVGYGHPAPSSDTGKAFSIVYASIGVPFTMSVLTACVQRVMYPSVLVPVSLSQRSGSKPRPATVSHFSSLSIVVVSCCFSAPAAVFSVVEASWSFLDGIYFCFISSCTIGSGDFIPAARPGQPYRASYQVAVMVYLFLGLMMMYLSSRTFHKMADVHGSTTYSQSPRCESSSSEDDAEPIVCNEPTTPRLKHKAASKPSDPGSQPSYNSINKG